MNSTETLTVGTKVFLARTKQVWTVTSEADAYGNFEITNRKGRVRDAHRGAVTPVG